MSTLAATSETLNLARWIPTLPFLAMLICGLLCCFHGERLRKLAAWVTTASVAIAFVISLMVFAAMGEAGAQGGVTVDYFRWINIGGFSANFSFFLDTLTMIMLIVVTGVGTLITIYAAGYMDGDHGYPRFFAYFGLFIFAMTTLVMADNLLLLYLGWEGVGVASYLLIGYYYRKPSAVAAAKKAFIVNRIGDFGFALGIMSIFLVFGAVGYDAIIPAAQAGLGQVDPATLSGPARAAYEQATAWGLGGETLSTLLLAIPFLLMLGAFGKSAQLPLHVWLPDAMEGPTPVSALIHAATMVTAGVYMIARLIAIFQLNTAALTVVATVGAVTALFAATIALCQYDLKRIWAYSTISQLGYMFLGVGVLGTTGAVFHLFTHAFFKALLFLTAGSVMHAMAGQLDLRKMSGLWRKMPITAGLMGIGCLALAGFPYITAGFYSKDKILADALVAYPVLGWIGIVTALLTAFYTFRLWFRVFPGETRFEMGREHHGYEVDAGHEDELPHAPHEAPWWPMNAPLVVLALGALLGGVAYPGLIESLGSASTAAVPETAKAQLAGMGDDVEHYHHAHHSAHLVVTWVAGLGAVLMIALAAYLHWLRRDITEKIAGALKPAVVLLNRKYYVDEVYNTVIRGGLHVLAWISYMIDRVLVDGLLIDTLFGHSPRWLGSAGRGMQRGALQGYGLAMALGLALILFMVLWSAMP